MALEGMAKEAARKAFHCLSLVYLLAYHVWGSSWTLRFLGGFLAIEGSIEALRLRLPGLNAALMRFFGGIHREKETGRFTGIWWTAAGCWAAIYLYGAHPRIVHAALLYLAIGDGAAALVGKSMGRHAFSLRGRRKSWEGAAACLVACLACGWAAGLGGAAIWIGAASATLIELLPVPFDDNLWLPVLSGLVLYCLR